MKTYLVGGAVRDKLLGYPYHERDWVVVGARAEELEALGYQPVGKDFPVFLHPQTKEEYALARTEKKTGPGYTGFDCFAQPNVSLEEDLQRRDLTINAIAEDSDGQIIDPYGGQQDLHNKVLRHVSAAFTEDPVRVLRVARFHARYAHLGFSVAEETLNLMSEISRSGELQFLPAERVWKELERALTELSPQVFFSTLQQAGALAILIPEFCDLSQAILDTLATAAKKKCSSQICFALLFATLDDTTTNRICQSLRAPKDYCQLALLVSRFASQYRNADTSAEQLLTLLQQLDAFRRPERFNQYLQCCALLFASTDYQQQLQRALRSCNDIDAGTIAASGLQGKAIANQLYQQRLKAINNLGINPH